MIVAMKHANKQKNIYPYYLKLTFEECSVSHQQKSFSFIIGLSLEDPHRIIQHGERMLSDHVLSQTMTSKLSQPRNNDRFHKFLFLIVLWSLNLVSLLLSLRKSKATGLKKRKKVWSRTSKGRCPRKRKRKRRREIKKPAHGFPTETSAHWTERTGENL